MLNADSRTLKKESDDQTRKAAPRIPIEVALLWIVRITLTILELGDEVARLVHPARQPEQREREEEERHEREQREVGDHRREVRAPVGEELREGLAQMHGGSVCCRWTRRKRYPS